MKCSSNFNDFLCIIGMYNKTEMVLKWEMYSPISFDPEMHLTEYNMQSFWYNETIVNSDGINLRHGSFGK